MKRFANRIHLPHKSFENILEIVSIDQIAADIELLQHPDEVLQ